MQRKFIVDGLTKKISGVIFYNESNDTYMIELSGYLKSDYYFRIMWDKGIRVIGEEGAHWWVRNRITPLERQGIYEILAEWGLSESKEWEFLNCYNGRSAFDEQFLADCPEVLYQAWLSGLKQ